MNILEVVAAGRRITTDIGKRAYEETGLTPTEREWKGCGLTAVAEACGVSQRELDDILGEPYRRNFIMGFDTRQPATPKLTDRACQGRSDGAAVYEAVTAEERVAVLV